MVYDSKVIQRITPLLRSVSLPVQLYDLKGQCLFPEGGANRVWNLSNPAPGINHHVGHCYLRFPDASPGLVLCAADSEPGVQDVLSLLDLLLTRELLEVTGTEGTTEFYRKVLRQEITGPEMMAKAEELRIPLRRPRCVLFFQLELPEETTAVHLLAEFLPLLPTDVLLGLSRRTAALVKDMEPGEELEEVIQFALAVHETLREETGLCPVIGIGGEKESLLQLPDSFQEAKRAMEVGRIFQADTPVHVFRQLLLEKILIDVPREESRQYCRQLFNTDTEKLFTPEMMLTVETFFHKNLSLSDTARQLYIHRNTLVYRLDKIQKLTGLDIRRFDDAVTFKILYELKLCNEENPIS